jgi:hypothetical protein
MLAAVRGDGVARWREHGRLVRAVLLDGSAAPAPTGPYWDSFRAFVVTLDLWWAPRNDYQCIMFVLVLKRVGSMCHTQLLGAEADFA